MIPVSEPPQLKRTLPKDILVLQTMQGHLELEPVLLLPGLRCVIGSAEQCAVRLTQSSIVQAEHCVVEVIGRRTILTNWTPEATWLNDRLVTESHELFPSDRIAIGPFDFRLRTASADEMRYAKLAFQDSNNVANVESALRLKQSTDLRFGDSEPSVTSDDELGLGALSDLISTTTNLGDGADSEPLSQRISKSLGDLQGQVVSLQERDAGLVMSFPRSSIARAIETARRVTERETTTHVDVQKLNDDRESLELAQRQLQAEREAFARDQATLAAEQAECRALCEQALLRHQELEAAIRELEADRQTMRSEQATCQQLADELRHQQRVLEERELSANKQFELQRTASSSVSQTVSDDSNLRVPTVAQAPVKIADRPLQTLLTLVAFGMAAMLLGWDFGAPEVSSIIGWTTALLGAISTLDMLCHRLFASR